MNEDLCTGCQECIAHCVYKEPKFRDEFNEGLGKRKPVYIPFPQATPQVVLIDPEVCLNFKRGVLTDKCKKTCVEACGDRKAIDFKQKEELREIKVGTIIVATGFQTFDVGADAAIRLRALSERLHRAGGRAPGQRLRPDRPAKSSCATASVPSRSASSTASARATRRPTAGARASAACTRMKLAHLLKEHTEAEIYNFYIDIRAPGKGYEEFYDKLLEEGVHFIRGRVGEVTDWAFDPRGGGQAGHPRRRTRWPACAADPGGHGGAGRPAWSRMPTRRTSAACST